MVIIMCAMFQILEWANSIENTLKYKTCRVRRRSWRIKNGGKKILEEEAGTRGQHASIEDPSLQGILGNKHIQMKAEPQKRRMKELGEANTPATAGRCHC